MWLRAKRQELGFTESLPALIWTMAELLLSSTEWKGNLPCVNERILYKNPYQVLITDTGAPPCPRPTPTMTPTVTQTQTPTLVPPSDIHHKYERCDYISSGYYKYEICP